jgi:condensin-2 complex subunit H2
MADSESRYAALINPVRDLALNWNIDIAHTLEDYMDELDEIKMTLGNRNDLNFAEAALLIQGSTSVYSKKVEHLYSLVYQALELITNQKPKNQETKEGTVKAIEEEDYLLWGSDPTYLLLDDVVAVATNIDIQFNFNADASQRRLSNVYFQLLICYAPVTISILYCRVVSL